MDHINIPDVDKYIKFELETDKMLKDDDGNYEDFWFYKSKKV